MSKPSHILPLALGLVLLGASFATAQTRTPTSPLDNPPANDPTTEPPEEGRPSGPPPGVTPTAPPSVPDSRLPRGAIMPAGGGPAVELDQLLPDGVASAAG